MTELDIVVDYGKPGAEFTVQPVNVSYSTEQWSDAVNTVVDGVGYPTWGAMSTQDRIQMVLEHLGYRPDVPLDLYQEMKDYV